MEGFIGQISDFCFDFAPYDWAFCDGSLLPLNQYTALFSLIGVVYGGDGRTNFALPDLTMRSPCGAGAGPGLTVRRAGQPFGAATVTLTEAQIPAHTHGVRAAMKTRSTAYTDPNINASLTSSSSPVYSTSQPNTQMSPLSIANSGGTQPHNNMQPYVATNYCIALQGEYPQFD